MIGPLEKQPKESESLYYKRIFQKLVDEQDEEFEKRVEIIKKCLPSLNVWQNDDYKKFITTPIRSKEDMSKEYSGISPKIVASADVS